MSRYRKIEVRTWADAKFRKLTPIPPCGQGLWFFLLTGPFTGPIPGLFRAGRAAMAEELGWSTEAFDEAFREVLEQGMAEADFTARLVWLPKALNYNRPENPNVVKSWRAELDLLPECDLKHRALAAIREHLQTLGNAYVAALFGDEGVVEKHIEKPSPKHSGKPLPKDMPNQEQEQEQEQEKRGARKSARTPSVQFSTWVSSLPEGEDAIPPDDPVFRFAADAGIPDDMLALAWSWFERTYTASRKAKRYADWRQVFRNAVQGNWGKLWRFTADGQCVLTSEGEMLRRALEAEARRAAA